MKNLLLLVFITLCSSLSYGQIKVFSDGQTTVGNNTVFPNAATLHVVGGPEGIQVQRADRPTDRYLRIAHGGNNGFVECNFGRFDFRVLGSTVFTADTNRNVGINQGAATERLDVRGNIKTNSMFVGSDINLKNNVNDFDLGLEAVMQLNPITYYYNEIAGDDPNQMFIGIAAQELQKVAPDLVVTHEYKTQQEGETDEQFKNRKGDEYLSIADNQVKYLLINAIKEQQALIAAQGEQIAALEEKINTIGTVEDVNTSQITLSEFDLAELNQNRPNPFAGETQIDYVVPTKANSAKINIYSVNGSLLKSLRIDHVGKGTLSVDANDLPSGTYSYQLVVDQKVISNNKMVVSK